MKKDKKAFSMIIAIGIVFVSILAALTIVEYMIPFLKNIRGVENSVGAYYNSYSGLEKGLYFLSTRAETEETSEEKVSIYNENGMVGYEYETFSSGTTLPAPTTGDSGFDQKYNTISMGNPIQLSIGYGYLNNASSFNIEFRVPDLDKNNIKEDLLTDALNNTYIINWQLSSDNATLNSTTGSLITAEKINGNTSGFNILGSDFKGYFIDGNNTGTLIDKGINEFYKGNGGNVGECGTSKKCILRFSVINSLKLSSGQRIAPYLEWRITTTPYTIPLRYSRIVSTGKEYGFKKELTIRVPQDTISEAFDFTVFQ